MVDPRMKGEMRLVCFPIFLIILYSANMGFQQSFEEDCKARQSWRWKKEEEQVVYRVIPHVLGSLDPATTKEISLVCVEASNVYQ